MAEPQAVKEDLEPDNNAEIADKQLSQDSENIKKEVETQDVIEATPVLLESFQNTMDKNQNIPIVSKPVAPMSKYIHMPTPRISTPPPLPPLLPPPQPDIFPLSDDAVDEDITNKKVECEDTILLDSSVENTDKTSIPDQDDDYDNDIPDTDDLTEPNNDGTEADGEKSKPNIISTSSVTELACCEYCGGPVKKRRIGSILKKFCSKVCARNCRRIKFKDEEGNAINTTDLTEAETPTGGVISASTVSESEHKITWDAYLQAATHKAAPESYFKHITTDVPGLKPGMKLEVVDRNNPPSYCVATVIKCVGHRVCIRYDGYGSDNTNDMWCNYQAEELHPIGWCAKNGYPLQPPKGVNSSLEAWRTFLTQTLTGALAAPQDLFRNSQEHFQPRVHGFEVGMKLEAIHPLRPSIICPATVTKSLGPYYFSVTPDFQHDLPPTTICCHSDSSGIFPIGWCYRNGIELTYPANYSKKTFDWPKYLSICRASAAPSPLFRKVKTHKFRVGMKVEAVDLEQPAVICVATITNLIGRLLLLFFDGQSRFQFVDVESPDIYPIGWCKRTGHPLVTPFGVMPSNYDSKTRVSESEVLYLPSFDEVMNRQNNALSSTVPILPRKITPRPEPDKEKDKDKDDGKGDLESEDKSGDSDLSEDDSLASERFYHNKNQIFFNKGCCIGPLLNPEQVKLLPDATPPGKVSTVIRTGLEMVAQAALDPEKVIDLMQEGCGVRVTIKHQGKLLKKAISRVDSRPKLERYLKRFCRRLICCEYFLSLKPVGQPCPDTCKSDDQGNLQGPKGLKAKRSREYFEVKHLGFEKKRRGRRRRKTEILLTHPLVMKATSGENGTPIPAVLPSTMRNRQLAPAYHLQPNGGAMNRPAVATAALPGVQAPVVRQVYPGTPGNVAIVRPNTSLQLPARPHGPSAIAPAQGGQIVIGSMHTSTPLAKQDGVLTNGRTLIMTDVSGSQQAPKQRIVTNVSGQRFSTSASSGGTTITFVRAPPNVTVCSSLTPPPLTRISDTVESITAEMNTSNSISPHPLPSPKLTGFTLGSSHKGGTSRGPPNVVVSSMAQVLAATGVVTQVTGTVASQFTSSSTSTGSSSSSTGVIRAPIVIPPQVKQETPPPPPLVHASKVPSGVRVMEPGTVVSTSKVSVLPLSYTQVRSFSHKSIASNAGQTLYKLGSSSSNSPTSRTIYVRPDSLKSDSSKHFSPNYQSFSQQRISPKPPPSMSQSVVASQPSKVAIAMNAKTGHYSVGQQVRPNIAAKKHSVIQTIHHNPASSQSNVASFQSKAVSTSIKPVSVQSGTLDKVRAGIRSKYLDYSLNSDARFVKREDNSIKEYNGIDGGVKDSKRDAWWLDKKRRRKRSRFSYLSSKYKNEDGSELSGEVYLSPDDDEDYYDEIFNYQDRPKRGRISELSDFVMRLDDEEGLAMVDDQDPDWDESAERKKIKQQMKPKKKGFGSKRKDGGSELSSPTLSNPPSPNLPSHPTLPTNTYINRPPSKPLDSKQHVLKLDPAPPRRPLSVTVDNKDSLSFKGKRSASYTTDGDQRRPIKSSSSHVTSPLSPKSPPLKKRKMVDVGVNTSLPGCVNGRSPDLPSNPVTWSVDQVIQYIRSTDCGHYAVVFKEEEIDGQALLMLSRDALMQFTPMKLGPTLKMCSYISQLRLRAK